MNTISFIATLAHGLVIHRPLIGGQLAKPHDRWPDVFTSPFWQYYPYFLPCAASAAFSAVIFFVASAYLREVRVEGNAFRDT